MALADLVKTRHKAKKSDDLLLPLVDQHLHLRQEEDRRDGWFHPSDLSGDFCARAWVLYNHHPEGRSVKDGSWSPRLKRILDNGTGFHNRIHRYLQKMGILWGTWRRPVALVEMLPDFFDPEVAYDPEQRARFGDMVIGPVDTPYIGFHVRGNIVYEYYVGFPPTLPNGEVDLRWEYCEVRLWHDEDRLLGHTDGVLNLPAGKYVLELKSANDHSFKWIPKSHHEEQDFLYLGALEWIRAQKEQGQLGGFVDNFDALPFEGIILVYENKNDQSLAEFRYTWDPARYESILAPKRARMREALEWTHGDPLPPCTCGQGNAASPLCKQLS